MNARQTVICTLAAACLLLIGVSCSGEAVSRDGRGSRIPGFSLAVLPESHLDGASRGSFSLLAAAGANGDAVVEVHVRQARRLRAALFTVSYDPARYAPAAVEPGPALAGVADGQLLELHTAQIPGLVQCGQVVPRWRQARGFDGSGVVAVLHFARRAAAGLTRAASTPPDTAASAAVLGFDGGSGMLSWRYYHQGDYNQDGTVGLTDLTPLGVHFGGSVAYPGEQNTARAVIDGNGDGSLNIGDLAPIGMNFGKDLSGGWIAYRTLNAADYPSSAADNNGGATVIDIKPAGAYDVSSSPASDRLLYTMAVPGPLAGETYWVRPRDAALSEGIASNSVANGSGNHPPVAVIDALPGTGGDAFSGPAPHFIRFESVHSTDPDLDPITVAWDLNGDTAADTFAASFPHTFTSPGTYPVTLTVSDGMLTDSASVEVTVTDPGAWHVQTLDGMLDDSGAYCSLMEYSGAPAVAFRRVAGAISEVDVVYGADPAGSAWSAATAVATASPGWIDAHSAGGSIAVAYYDMSGGFPFLNYTVFDPGLMGWIPPVTVDAEINAGNYCSLLDFNGAPRVAYYQTDGLDGQLRLAGAANTLGTAWNGPQLVDGAAGLNLGTWCSAADVNGRIGIAYFDNNGAQLAYAVATDASAVSWNIHPVLSVPGQDLGRYASLAVINGRPAIACADISTNETVYTSATDSYGETWDGAYSVVSTDAGQDCSLSEVAGQPAVAYRKIDGSLWYSRSHSAEVFFVGETTLIDDVLGENVGYYVDLKEINDIPMAVFYNQDSQDLKFAARYP